MKEEELDLEQLNEKNRKREERGLTNMLKHFDRIHDKLFSFNNILIVGFFTLSKIDNSISVINILIPIVNLVILIYIEYRMMNNGRYEAEISIKNQDDRTRQIKHTDNTTLYSLLTILTTFIVTVFFLYYLIW